MIPAGGIVTVRSSCSEASGADACYLLRANNLVDDDIAVVVRYRRRDGRQIIPVQEIRLSPAPQAIVAGRSATSSFVHNLVAASLS